MMILLLSSLLLLLGVVVGTAVNGLGDRWIVDDMVRMVRSLGHQRFSQSWYTIGLRFFDCQFFWF